MRFDAATDRISYSGSGLPDPETAWTLNCWVMVVVDRNDFSTFCRLSGAGATVATIATTETGTGGPIYATAGGVLTAAAGMTVGDWYKLAVTCTGTSGNLYTATATGSTQVVSGTVDGVSAPDQICFGGRASGEGAESLDGRIAYAKLYSSVLTQTQNETEWNSPTPVIVANLAGYWPLIHAADLTDRSGNARNLTAGSTAVTTEDGPPIAAWPSRLVSQYGF
ncbi:MAG: LamG-like jellyroll fold domain-containing protein [Gammaproteobacteria bacterium]